MMTKCTQNCVQVYQKITTEHADRKYRFTCKTFAQYCVKLLAEESWILFTTLLT